MKIADVMGNSQRLDGGAMFGNAPRAVWQMWMPPDAEGRIELACRCLLLEIDGKKILFETGIGAFFAPELAERYGVTEQDHVLLTSLEKAGVSPAQIDFVVLSHLHFDHAGGLLSKYAAGAEPRIVFENAKIVVGEEAWQRAQAPHARDRASFVPALNQLLAESGRLIIVPAREVQCEALPPAIKFFYSDGHTPGQMHAVIHAAKAEDLGGYPGVVFCGDLIPGLSWVHLPITMGYDRYPEKLIDEKAELYAKYKGFLYFFTHDPKTAAATIEVDSKGRFKPLVMVDTFDHKGGF